MERQHPCAGVQAEVHRHPHERRRRGHRRRTVGGLSDLNLLAIETSCDETAAAVLRDGRGIVSSVVSSQIALHAQHGGVVPELAARAHLEALATVVDAALRPLARGWADVDAVAVTRGPGLPGCLLVGVVFAQAVALTRGIPIVGVSHLAGHVYSAWLAEPDLEPPYTALLVSGGHTECVELRDHGVAERLAHTRDDAAGEAFDKAARMLGLAYPGGPAIERAAAGGDPARFPLPRTRLDRAFSFSGLKTAVRYLVRDIGAPDQAAVRDIAASFQAAVVDQLVAGLEDAVDCTSATTVALVGGVAANRALRDAVTRRFGGLRVAIAPLELCTDNAAMIGAAGWNRLRVHGPDAPGFDIDPSLAECA